MPVRRLKEACWHRHPARHEEVKEPDPKSSLFDSKVHIPNVIVDGAFSGDAELSSPGCSWSECPKPAAVPSGGCLVTST